jgi:hypothetical protein
LFLENGQVFRFRSHRSYKKQGNKEREAKIRLYIESFRREVETLISEAAFTKTSGEPLPPWIARIYPLDIPGIDEIDVFSKSGGDDYWFWRGGDGGSYRTGFLQYFYALSLEQRVEYFRKYDLGARWSEREKWAFQLFDDEVLDISEEQWEELMDKVLNTQAQRTA